MSVKSFKTSGVGVDLAPKGLVLINTTSFSAVSSVSLPNNTFTSTYDDYFLMIASTGSGSGTDMRMRMRASGTDETGSNYARQRFHCFSTSGDSSRSTAQTSMDFGSTVSSKNNTIMTLFKPKAAENTTFISSSANNLVTPEFLLYSGGLNNSTSYDSATVLVSSGTFTGVITVFGYAK
jgi:hypothetical protein